jgi:hypothetical protein
MARGVSRQVDEPAAGEDHDQLDVLHAAVLEDPDIDVEVTVEAREARAGCWRNVSVSRMTRCPRCVAQPYRIEQGCARCRKGLVIRTEVLRMHIPPGTASGARMRMRRKGHETPSGETGDLYATIEVTSFILRARAVLGRINLPSIPRDFRSIATALVVVAIFGGAAWSWMKERERRRPLGEACADANDCRSGECLALYEQNTLPLPGGKPITLLPHRTGGVCTTSCDDDGDCPATMSCIPIEKSTGMRGGIDLGPSGRPNALACGPR